MEKVRAERGQSGRPTKERRKRRGRGSPAILPPTKAAVIPTP